MVGSFKFQLVTSNSLTTFMGLQEVTAVEFDGDGDYLMAVGSSAGKVWFKQIIWQWIVNILFCVLISALDF